MDSEFGMSFSYNHFMSSWQSPLFEQDRNIERTLGMKPLSPPEKEAIYLKSRNGYLNSEMCVFNTLNLMYYYQYGR